MKDIFGKIKLTFGITFGIIILILFSPIFLLLYPFMVFGNRKFEKEYQDFLNKNNGAKFFCYTSRKNSMELIENSILPKLAENINVIFLNGKNPKSSFPERYISSMLYRIDNIGFPNIMKIVNGKVIDISLKKEFYNKLNSDLKMSKFIEELNLGFQRIDEEKTVYNST